MANSDLGEGKMCLAVRAVFVINTRKPTAEPKLNKVKKK